MRGCWIALALIVGCGPNVGSDGEAGGETETTSEDTGTTMGPITTTTTTSTTTVDPTVMSTVSSLDTSTTVVPETEGTTDCLGGGGSNPLGAACVVNADCASGVCRAWSDAPPDPDRYCEEAPLDCSTVITGTVWRLPQSPAGLPDVPVRVLGALDAITNPQGAQALVETISDAAGHVDVATDGPASAAIALIAIAGGDATYFPTAVGIASENLDGMYEVGAPIHDLWALPTSTLDAFNAALAADPTVPDEMLPLGELGGVVGIVRDAGGTPIVGAVVESTSGSSSAIIRYVADDGSVGTMGTQSSGAFIVLGPTPTGEEFAATLEGAPLSTGTAGTANGVVFALPLTGV